MPYAMVDVPGGDRPDGLAVVEILVQKSMRRVRRGWHPFPGGGLEDA